ncbi:unnamed protein product [Ixodes persulcatus]
MVSVQITAQPDVLRPEDKRSLSRNERPSSLICGCRTKMPEGTMQMPAERRIASCVRMHEPQTSFALRRKGQTAMVSGGDTRRPRAVRNGTGRRARTSSLPREAWLQHDVSMLLAVCEPRVLVRGNN